MQKILFAILALLCFALTAFRFTGGGVPAFSGSDETSSIRIVQNASSRLLSVAHPLSEQEAAVRIRKASAADMRRILDTVPRKKRLAVFFDMCRIRGSLSEAGFQAAGRMSARLLEKDFFLSFALKHEPQLGRILSDIESGRQTFAGPVVYNARVVNFSDVMKLDVNLVPSIRKIRSGSLRAQANDGWKVFGNYERILPRAPKGYYREMRVQTPRIRGAGPQRLVYGQKGELYYTPDHYRTFYPIEAE